ncbi:hypothetical protein HN51_039428 [Arachis hypogaea]
MLPSIQHHCTAINSATLDCVVVGGGITDLSVAHALSSNHSIPNVVLTGRLSLERRSQQLPTLRFYDQFLVECGLEDELDHEESVQEFVCRNLGDEVFERLIEPFCLGVYAGDPSKLSMKAAYGKIWKLEQNGGSIIGGSFKAIQERNKSSCRHLPKPKGQTVGSCRKGMGMLPEAISARLGNRVKLSWKLSSINRVESGHCCALHPLVSFLSWIIFIIYDMNAAADALSKIYYPPVAVVSISYPKEAILTECLIDGELKGFGQLHPRSQGVETLGTRYSSSIFTNRAPPGQLLLLNFIGGATNPGMLSKMDRELIQVADRDLRKILINPNANNPTVLGVKLWPKAIPQFLIGHVELLNFAKAALKDTGFEGLFLGGNYVSGVALGACVADRCKSSLYCVGLSILDTSKKLGICLVLPQYFPCHTHQGG